jgi:hypothetical protein
MKPEGLQPGDVLLYRTNGETLGIGPLISAGQWNGKPAESLQHVHVALVFDGVHACEMNPPHARLVLLDGEDWSRIDVFRMDVGGANPFSQAPVLRAFQVSVLNHVGPDHPYNFDRIARFGVLGLLSRIGFGRLTRWILSGDYPESKYEVCSTWVEDRITDAMRAVDPTFDLFPDLGANQAMPADYPRSPWLKQIA